MSSTVENRAAVFTREPQAVEVYQAGAWWSGELLGWRHAVDGSCQVRVRVVLDGVEETAWTALETLRLPERHLATSPGPGEVRTGDRDLSVARHPSSRRHRADAGSPTESLPVIRGLSVVPGVTVAPSGGRRRAPDVPVPASPGGRRRAPDVPVPASPGGRRRAPEVPVPAAPPGGRRRVPEEAAATGGRRRAPEDAASGTGPAAPLGRHGVATPAAASAGPGRHRTADTGSLPAVPVATATREHVGRSAGPATVRRAAGVQGPRAAEPVGPGRGGADGSPGGADPERRTRTVRLSDHAPLPRRPSTDRSRPGG